VAGAAHAVVPDSDGRDSSVGAPSSPDLATSPGPYSDDFMEDELADLEGAVLSERPEDVREYASRVLYYLRDLEVRGFVGSERFERTCPSLTRALACLDPVTTS